MRNSGSDPKWPWWKAPGERCTFPSLSGGGPLTLNAEAYAVVPVRPARVLHVGIVTPALNPDSRLTTMFKLCLREEAKFIKERLTHRFGNLNAPRNRETSLRTVKPRDRALSSKS